MAMKKSNSEPISDKPQKSNEQQKPVPVPLPESKWAFHKAILAEWQSSLPIWVRAPSVGQNFIRLSLDQSCTNSPQKGASAQSAYANLERFAARGCSIFNPSW
jgi:hypothetical protein